MLSLFFAMFSKKFFKHASVLYPTKSRVFHDPNSVRRGLFFKISTIHCGYEERRRARSDSRDTAGQQRLRLVCGQRRQSLRH